MAINASPRDPLVLVLTTEADQTKADGLAQALLEQGLAACVSCSPVRSTYRWQGQLECAHEVQLWIKTTRQGWPRLEQALPVLHSYDTPEILHWEVQASESYGAWVQDSVAQAPRGFS
ncbi:MAG: divalent-cation tolerance protein CutA [Synechococcus sp.]|nr:divalent-cation tolerance protein CutA [Synechococcus sp.]